MSSEKSAPGTPGIQLLFKVGSFDPLKDPEPLPDDLKCPETGYYIMQFSGPVLQEWKDAVTAIGGTIFWYMPDYAFIVRLTSNQKQAVNGLPFVRWLGTFHPGYKLAPELSAESGRIMMSVIFLENPDAVEKAIMEMGLTILWRDWLAIRVEADVSFSRSIAFLPEVGYVEPLHTPTICNDNSARIMNARQTNDGNFTDDGQSVWSYNATKFEGTTGKGVIVAVSDTGVDGNHLDLTGKKVWFGDYMGTGQWQDSMGHGTHVAGTVLGTGQGQAGKYAGLAPEATLIGMSAIGGSITPEATNAQTLKDAVNHGASVCTNSWGDPSQHGTYGSMAIAYDTGVRDADPSLPGNQSIIVVFAAGNEGFSGIREPATAKNVITIGATGNNRPLAPDQVAGFSSNGPTSDGRRKPDVMSPGAQVTSLQYGTQAGYVTHDGTSMAAPGAAGCIALIVQYYWDNYGEKPSPAMVKALLSCGADQMANTYTYPGNGQGWGRINVAKTLLSNFTYKILSEDQK